MHFIKADAYTEECFNPHGLKPYDAILMVTTSMDEGFAPYDLTILEGCPSSVDGLHYLAAHGGVVEPLIFKTIDDAKRYIVEWYFVHRQIVASKNSLYA
jgi:hypothetical protein